MGVGDTVIELSIYHERQHTFLIFICNDDALFV